MNKFKQRISQANNKKTNKDDTIKRNSKVNNKYINFILQSSSKYNEKKYQITNEKKFDLKKREEKKYFDVEQTLLMDLNKKNEKSNISKNYSLFSHLSKFDEKDEMNLFDDESTILQNKNIDLN